MNIFDKILYSIFFIILAVFFVKFFLLGLLMALILFWLRTLQMRMEPNHKEFLGGKLPNPKPNGFYRGSIGFRVSWIGKKFDAENGVGINVFCDERGKQTEKYKFKTLLGSGLFDQHLIVLKIDYNVKSNPFWIRCILDEIIEVAPNEYLGKMHLRIIPGFPFSVLYFELKKA